MRPRVVACLVIGFVLGAVGICPEPSLAQSDPPRPAVLTSPVNPIGKVVKVTGSVTIEHVSAVVLQASVGQSDRVKSVMRSTKAMWCKREPTA